MKSFAYWTAADFASASKALAGSQAAIAKSGGTDLLDRLKERVDEPDAVVDLLRADRGEAQGELSALATLAEIAVDEWVLREFPAVAKAAGEAATPQIRNVGTLGGNLCQHTRCWYFRNRHASCFKRGTGPCSAMADGGQNRYHAVFPADYCASAHPSNLAPALIAVGAKADCVHPDGGRMLDIELLYEAPRQGVHGDTTLREGELIRAVRLEPTPLAARSTYVEFRERQSFDFALASVAAALHLENGVVRDARVVLGAVAPVPMRAREAENALVGKKPDEATIAAACEAAAAGATPLDHNGFKIPILKALVRQALEELRS